MIDEEIMAAAVRAPRVCDAASHVRRTAVVCSNRVRVVERAVGA